MDMYSWSIKPKNSIITKKVDRHSNLDALKKKLEKKYPVCKKLDMGNIKWPKKKRFGKNAKLYKDRYKYMVHFIHAHIYNIILYYIFII